MFTVVPRVLDDVEPLCRSVRKPERKDCRAVVSAVPPVDDAPVDAVEEDVPVLDVPEVVPPKSEINFENAVFNAEMVLDDTVDEPPCAVEALVKSSLLLKSLTSAVSAAVIPLCA